MSNHRSAVAIKNELARVREAHSKLNAQVDRLHRRQGLGNSMELQGMKNRRAGYKRRMSELEAELSAASVRSEPSLAIA